MIFGHCASVKRFCPLSYHEAISAKVLFFKVAKVGGCVVTYVLSQYIC